MEINAFKRGMASLVMAFPNRTFDNNIMFDFLQDLTDEEFLTAVGKVLSEHQEMFPGTNIIALIRDKAKGKALPLAGEAWAEVKAQISSVGSWGAPTFKDKVTERAVAAIGWRDICMSENPSVERAHFLKIYEAMSKREHEEQLALPPSVARQILRITER